MRTVQFDYEVAAPPDLVFAALTDPRGRGEPADMKQEIPLTEEECAAVDDGL